MNDEPIERITRRTGLKFGAAALVSSLAARSLATSPQAAVDPPLPTGAAPSIQAIAARRGMRFGSAVNAAPPGANAGSFNNPAYAGLLKRDCGLLVAENEMKWQALRPAPDRFDFAAADAIVGWAERNGFAVRGHNLLWHQPKWMPAWERSYDFGANPRAEADRLLTHHITTVCRRYHGRIHSYDVVNEAVNNVDGTLYDTALSTAMGGALPTLDLAFHTARAAAPNAQLVYNDYMSWEPGKEKHRAGVLRLLRGFRDRGVPVDALGVQSHIWTSGPDIAATVVAQQGPWRAFLDEVTGMGYDLLITELDVHDSGLPVDKQPRDRAVADYVRAYLDLMFAYPQLRDVLAWGMSDRYSWLQKSEPRDDGIARRPCPYDDDFRAKPMRDAIANAFAHAPPRQQKHASG
ncbi:glycosyl hydrolase [Sphingomonas koreensis]|nr:glycosyl hydrolase [Sphingomonas koreensis]